MLGLSEPWQVEDVKLDLAGKKVEVRVAVRRRAAGRRYHRADCRLPTADCRPADLPPLSAPPPGYGARYSVYNTLLGRAAPPPGGRRPGHPAPP